MNRMSHPQILAIALSLAGLFCSAAVLAGSEAVAKPASRNDFVLLAGEVARADPLARFDFATLALHELITVYEDSYRESAHERHDQAKAQLKLARWRRESKAFVDQLKAVSAGVSDQSRIEITVERSGPPILFIDDTPVVISGPEIGKAGLMEQRIMQRFCQLHECQRFRPPPAEPRVSEPERVAGGWQLTQRREASYETGDGLIFRFRSLENRQEKQARCEAIARDLRRLVAGIRRAREAGYSVDWRQLRIATLHDGVSEHIVINGTGDYIKLELDYFGSAREPDPALLGWAEKRAAGETSSVVIADAERLLR